MPSNTAGNIPIPTHTVNPNEKTLRPMPVFPDRTERFHLQLSTCREADFLLHLAQGLVGQVGGRLGVFVQDAL